MAHTTPGGYRFELRTITAAVVVEPRSLRGIAWLTQHLEVIALIGTALRARNDMVDSKVLGGSAAETRATLVRDDLHSSARANSTFHDTLLSARNCSSNCQESPTLCQLLQNAHLWSLHLWVRPNQNGPINQTTR